MGIKFKNTLKMATIRLAIVLTTLISYSNSEYIPPGPAYPCPKEIDKQKLLYPCVCEKGTDEGLYVHCENTGLAPLSVGLSNIASLELPIESLIIKDCKISNLFGPLFHRSTIRVINIIDTPIETIDQYTFAGVNRTLQELYMVNTKISQFPKQAFQFLSNLKILTIDGHQMNKLDKDIFTGSEAVGRIERLSLINGLLSDIPIEAFQNLKKLKFLDLHANRLATLKKNQFKGLRDTEVLDLSHNNITKLDGTHMGDMTKLGWCNASHNQITEIARGMFARNTILKVVHLDHNKIKKLDTNTFKGMRLLRRLFLQDNIITDVGRGTFASLSRIGTIDLARNLLTKVDYQMFKEVKYAELLNLAENQITMIEGQAFTDLYLATVNISYNQLADIEAGAFQNCNNLTVLDFSHNQLKGINVKAFDENSYAYKLDVSYNQLTDFGQIPLHNMTGIQIVNASYNAITTVPRNAFPKLYELNAVDLSHNNLTDIYNAVFQNLFSIRYLNLSYNSMEVIKPATFGTIPTLLELNLSHNKLRDVSKSSLFKMASCRVLDISYNQLDKIFQIPISLGELNFAYNNLTEIKINTWPTMNALLRLNFSHNMLEDRLDGNSFSGLLTVQHLDLSANGITRPPWEALNTLNSLQYLYMQNNNLTSLSKSAFGNLPTMFMLDLSHNQLSDIAPLTFNNLMQLLDLSLSGNNITYLPNEVFKTLVALRKLDLSHNKLERIDNKTHSLLDDCLSLEMVNLSYNRISLLSKKMFPSNRWIPYRLMDVDLSHNEIPVLTLAITQGAGKVKRLNLAGNIINDIRNDVLGNLTSLEVLDLSNNRIRNLVSKTTDLKFHLPANITELHLEDNMLEVLPLENIIKAENLKLLDVRNNHLKTFDMELVRKMETGTDMQFEGNPLTCDCLIRPLKHHINKLSQVEMSLPRYNLTCADPLPLEHESLLSVDEERLLCAGNVAMEEKLKKIGSDADFKTLPDLQFRDIQFSQQSINTQWLVNSNGDVADFVVYIRDDNNKVYYSNDVSYNLRALSITIDEELKTSLKNGTAFDVCIQAKTSNNFPRKWHVDQCRRVPPHYDNWEKKLTNDVKKIFRKRYSYKWLKGNAIGMVSDSILITLCIFLGVWFRRLADFDF